MNATVTRTGHPDCPVCNGSGHDDAFDSACNCAKMMRRSTFADTALQANVGQTTYRDRTGEPYRPPTGRTAHTSNVRSNKYAARCATCGVWVPEGAGRIEHIAGKWATFHVTPCVKPEPQATPPAAARNTTGVDLSKLPAGMYAVPGGDTRLKVRIDKPAKGKWLGWTFVKDGAEYGEGKRYGSQRPGERYVGAIADALAAIVADPAGAAARYGELTGQCSSCNRTLEDKLSVERGVGPICWAKYWSGQS